jgi:hypothetical protein
MISSLGFLAQAIGVSGPQWMRAEANKQASWKCTDELGETKAEKAEWKARWFCDVRAQCEVLP